MKTPLFSFFSENSRIYFCEAKPKKHSTPVLLLEISFCLSNCCDSLAREYFLGIKICEQLKFE
jgi:hypothetical protein